MVDDRWWFQIFFIFTPTWGDDPNLTKSFQMGWNHHLVGVFFVFFVQPPNSRKFNKGHEQERQRVFSTGMKRVTQWFKGEDLSCYI